jgi:hypothetical protein
MARRDLLAGSASIAIAGATGGVHSFPSWSGVTIINGDKT